MLMYCIFITRTPTTPSFTSAARLTIPTKHNCYKIIEPNSKSCASNHVLMS